MVAVAAASALTVFYGPGAYGSGVADIVATLNGVNLPGVLTFPTFLTKTLASTLAVIGGLCVGKEGPLAHIGANIGVAVAYLPLPYYQHLRNDKSKRHLIAAGASAGIAAAFGAPVGGALLTYELSRPATFWTFKTTWKVFMACATSVMALALCQDLMLYGEVRNVSASTLNFVYGDQLTNATIKTIPACLVNGLICGVLGAVFVKLNFKLAAYRRRYLNNPWLRVAEAIFFSLLTTSSFFWLPKFFRADCVERSAVNDFNKDLIVRYNCPEGKYNPFATLFFSTEGDALRSILSNFETDGGIGGNLMHFRIFACTWYALTTMSYGVWVPAGLFVPAIVIGSSIGAVMEMTYQKVFEYKLETPQDYLIAEVPILVSAAAMLTAQFRITFSLVVIMMETTASIHIFAPMMFGCIVASQVADRISPSFYEKTMATKKVQFLP